MSDSSILEKDVVYPIVAGPHASDFSVIRSISRVFTVELPPGERVEFSCDLIQIQREEPAAGGLYWVSLRGVFLNGNGQKFVAKYNPVTHTGELHLP